MTASFTQPSEPAEKAATALKFAASALEHAEHGRSLRATADIQCAIAAFEAVLKDYGVQLCNVLPTARCNVCGRAAIEYAVSSNRVTCILCAHQRLEEAAQFARDEVASEPDPAASRLGVLQAAVSAVHDRGDKHGSPCTTFPRIAQMWNVLLGESRFSAVDVALCLAALKLIRASVNPEHSDNWVDVAGYAACGSEVASGEMPAGSVVDDLVRHLREVGAP